MSGQTSGTIPALESSTPEDHGATVVLITYIFLAFTVIAMAGRIGATSYKKRTIEQDDIFLMLATVRYPFTSSSTNIDSYQFADV